MVEGLITLRVRLDKSFEFLTKGDIVICLMIILKIKVVGGNMMYSEKGFVKVFNGEKFKTVSYLKEGNTIIFCTGNNTNKYGHIVKDNKIKVLEGDVEKVYDVELIEDKDKVDEIFATLKQRKAIPFFIPRKNKIVMKYKIN